MNIQEYYKQAYYNGYQDRYREESYDPLKHEFPCEAPQVSDGYHTFEELYNHRMILFSIICNSYPHRAWKSKLHHDGTMYDNYFIEFLRGNHLSLGGGGNGGFFKI